MTIDDEKFITTDGESFITAILSQQRQRTQG